MNNFKLAESLDPTEAVALTPAGQIFWMMANTVLWQQGEPLIDWAFRAWHIANSEGADFSLEDAQEAYAMVGGRIEFR